MTKAKAILAGILAGAGGTLGALGVLRASFLTALIGVALLVVGWTIFKRQIPQ